VRDAFNERYHDAWSNDLKNPEGKFYYRHLMGDSLELLKSDPQWDLLIAHPPCDYLTNSAAWAFGDGPYHQKVKPETLVGQARREAREKAAAFFLALWNCSIPRICIAPPPELRNYEDQFARSAISVAEAKDRHEPTGLPGGISVASKECRPFKACRSIARSGSGTTVKSFGASLPKP